jgi:hypothetical protein
MTNQKSRTPHPIINCQQKKKYCAIHLLSIHYLSSQWHRKDESSSQGFSPIHSPPPQPIIDSFFFCFWGMFLS